MAKISLRKRIERGVFLLDGAMGTQLFARGVEVGTCTDYLNVQSPDVVCEVHRAYLDAGSDAVLTNTFGANRYALGRHGLGGEVAAINRAGAEAARRAAGKEKCVLGDIGPSGDFLEPLGALKADDLEEAFAVQARALVAGGVDGLIVETMTALDEVRIAIEAAKSVARNLPVFASMSFDKVGDGFKTMMGVDVESAVAKMLAAGADAVGFNCGTATLDEYVELAANFVSAVEALEKTRLTSHGSLVTIFAEPNAGKPELIDGKAVYRVTPEEFAAAAEKIHAAGITIIGGCCGTTPQHIAAAARALRS
ncbi:MAG TPA: homocysteine S-methyltransferase family protein [Sedimentisphaerales bacterium]|nr:homocysteine S-methyltransferase family protein [Sedimentisphaerales bacterium]